MPHLLNIIFF